MPKPPGQPRVSFPHRGLVDQTTYIDMPGDAAPVGSMINCRPTDTVFGRFRGGTRPGLRQVRDPSGQPWGKIGDGPIQAIHEIPRPAEITGYRLGTGLATHFAFESRNAGEVVGNLFILRNKDATPYLSRYHAIGGAASFEDPTDRDLTAVVWTGPAALAGGVNENPFATDADDNGFGNPGWTAMDNWDTGGGAFSTLGGPWPTEQVAIFYGDTTLGSYLFVASSVTAGRTIGMTSEPMNRGFLVVYDLAGTGVLAVPVGKVARLRLKGKLYHETNPGTPSSLAESPSLLVNAGAIEITSIVPKEIAGQKYLYFTYDAARRGESMIGRINVTNVATTGLDLLTPGSGAFQTNGAWFGFSAAIFEIPASALDPHHLSVNYPRGTRPTAIDVDSLGFIYYTCSSAGEGVYSDPQAPNYRPDHHPDFAGHRPITVCKVAPDGSRFEWEAVTNYDPSQGGYARLGDPELIWCKADDTGCYVGGRTVGDANVFAINGADGGIRWRWRSGSAGGTARTYAAAIDPTDGNLWVVGDRTNAWQGVTDSKYANLWKLDVDSGAVIQSHDLGPGVNAISIAINPENGLIAVGTLCPAA